MIITENKSKRVVQSHDFDSVKCTIDAEDMRYVASLLRNNYSNTRLAVVREISANALDANLEANASRPIEIKLPTTMNPTFSVRDFGGGLSQEDVFGLYSKYGKSTKRTSNSYIGAFGIGKFAPLSYGDNFTCVSFHGGKKTSYNIFVNEDDDTKIVKLDEELSDEPSGLRVEVAVSDDDTSEFRDVVKNFFKFFSDEEMPKFIGVEENFIEKEEKILASKTDDWFVLATENSYYSRHESHVIMGRVAYPLDRGAINVENFLKDDKEKINLEGLVGNLLQMDGFYLRMPLGSVKLHHSRESLEYNKTTQQKIVESLLVVVREIQEIAKEKLADSPDLWEAKRNYAKIVNAMPHNMRSIFDNSFEWNGLKIDSPDFNRNYQLQDDLIITHSWREKDADSRNGFKIRSQKTNRAICQDNYLFVIQDLDSSHGNNLRLRTLVNDDDSLEGVYFIHPKTQVAEDEVWNEWQLGRVSEKHIRYTSNVDKEKPQRSGVRKGNGSRANIPLFTYNTEGKHVYKNVDHWINASETIKEIDDASEMEGSWKGKLVFVPIKNYKIDMEEFASLDAMKSRLLRLGELFGEESEENNLKLFGVRTGDVKKLDKSLWINFVDFWKAICKEIVLDNLEECNLSYTSLEICNGEDSGAIMSYHETFGKIFTDESFKLDGDQSHKLIASKELWISYDKSRANGGSYRPYVAYLIASEKDWVKDNLTVRVNSEEFLSMLKDLDASYPMLRHFSEHYSSWRGMEKTLVKDINDYISLCDGDGA